MTQLLMWAGYILAGITIAYLGIETLITILNWITL